jgi:hypothetical protein
VGIEDDGERTTFARDICQKIRKHRFKNILERLSMTSLPQPTLPPISSLYNGSSHDRVIDLSVNKSVSSEESEDNESKGGNSIRSKSPPM